MLVLSSVWGPFLSAPPIITFFFNPLPRPFLSFLWLEPLPLGQWLQNIYLQPRYLCRVPTEGIQMSTKYFCLDV